VVVVVVLLRVAPQEELQVVTTVPVVVVEMVAAVEGLERQEQFASNGKGDTKMNYAAIDKATKLVINNIEWDGESYLDPYLKEECDLVPWDETTRGYPVSVGATYDEVSQGFIPLIPEQNPSFIFNKTAWTWEPPISYPTDGGTHNWNESDQQWDLVTPIPQKQLENENQQIVDIVNG
jgi:hypothetical protein